MSYNYNDCNNTPGWGVGASTVIGAALGYWAGKANSGPGGAWGNGYAYGAGAYGAPAAFAAGAYAADYGHCRTCYQEGVESGQTLAGLNFVGQQVAANNRDIGNTFVALSNKLQNQTAAIQARFDALSQQKIADQAAQIAALRTQNIIGANAAVTNTYLTSINDKISSIVTNCGVRSYPGCPNTCGCTNQ